ncbi:MAG: MFS transporter [Verrucomicrobiota bacterium]
MRKASITRNALRISTTEGSWASVHFVLTSGAFFTGFALLLGANDFQLALLTAIPVLAQVFQIPGAWLVEKTGLRKPIVAWFSVASRTLWFPIALIPFALKSHMVLLFMVLYLLSSIAMHLAVAGWVTWMSALVPSTIRGRYFATRNRINGAVSIVASLAAGFTIDAFNQHGLYYGGYLTLQLIAVAAGLMALRLILRQPDPDSRPEPVPALLKYVVQPMRDARYRRIIISYLYWLFAVSLASPFFNAHLIKHMRWNFKGIALLGVISAVTTILFQRVWGRMVDRFGHKPVLIINALGIIQLPFYYAFCPWDLRWPIYVNAVFSGLFWAGFGLASFNLVIEVLPSSQRTIYVAVLSALNGITSFLASTLSGWIASLLVDFRWQFMGLTVINYQLLFIMTGLLRIPGLVFFRNIQEPGAVQTRVVVRHLLAELNRRIGFGRPTFAVPLKDSGPELPKPD